MSADLAAFLLARLDEDEQVAQVATYCQEDADHDVTEWHVEEPDRLAEVFGSDGLGIIQARTQHPGMLAHIARHDPARVLREVAAKRRMIELYEHKVESMAAYPNQGNAGGLMALDGMLRLLAQGYADHADYQPEWKP